MKKKRWNLNVDTAKIILESISDGVFTIDHAWRITSFNRAAEEITGVPRDEAIGKPCCEVFRASMCETECSLRQTMESGKPKINKTGFIIDTIGRRIPVAVSTALLYDSGGNLVGGVETFRDLSLVEELRKELEERVQIGDIVSRSPSMRKIFEILPQVASSDCTVLIQGETGTGKELLAREIHRVSSRNSQAFVAVNCAALPDTLLESELFGYKAGAFTGAQKDKPGRFSLAQGGTIFLDEIGDISASLQVRLLRVLQEKNFEPLGSTHPEKADVRIITATNKNLYSLVENGFFRQDLFYRIHVVKLELPPLRHRKTDIPLLVDRFIEQFNRVLGKRIAGIRQEALSVLMAHDYPGNIRELRNIIEHAFVLCEKGLIEMKHLPGTLVPISPSQIQGKKMDEIVKTVMSQIILDVLRRNRYNRLSTAQELGIHKSTLFRKIKELGIVLPDAEKTG